MTDSITIKRLPSRLVRTDMYIDGEWTPSSSGERVAVIDPATGKSIVDVAYASTEDVEMAVAAASAAFPSWAAMTAVGRSEILRRWYEIIMENADDLAAILTSEQGKPLSEAVGEIRYGAKFIEWFAEEAKRVYGEIIPTNVEGRRLLTMRQAVGPCAAITPWNFPMAMIARKAAPILAAGCTLVVKPASETPLSALAMAALAHEAGIPPGVFNVIPGSGRVVGDRLSTHPKIRAISFTGSTEVGKKIMAQAASNVKRVALELGGNAPVIVFDDADLETAVEGAIASKFRNAGQTCVCANRIYVQAGIHDRFVERFALAVSELTVGDGAVHGTDQGPLINEAAVEKVERHLADAVAKGADVLVGGGRHGLGGTFFKPTVIAKATASMDIAQEETFGPLAAVFRFTTEEEVIAEANDTPFGLAAYFFTTDLGRTFRVGEALEYGVIGVNTGLFSYEGAPFGGVKESGTGREGSRHGIEEFTEIKYMCIAGIGA
jgi:succinate-semialdehyde dehydrogenase/glutarate-semialdehyde dehydrogenase